MRATRSSAPTTSAPAARASAAAAPAANTATRTSLPVPAGSETVPRTTWSARRGSTPSLTANSTVSSKPAKARLFTMSSASPGAWSRWRSKRRAASTYFLPRCGMFDLLPRDPDAHRTRGAGHLLLGGVDVVGVQVGHLRLGDLGQLRVGDRAR